jgi:hypothetical protein
VSAQRIFGRPWGEIPATLKAEVALNLAIVPVGLLTTDRHVTAGFVVFAIAFALFIPWRLLRGGRIIWCFVLASQILGVINPFLSSSTPWWWIPTSLASVALLLWPSSRRYVWERSPGEPPGSPAPAYQDPRP